MAFASAHYEPVRGLVSPDVCRLVYDYVQLRQRTGTMLAPDQRVAGADRLYCDMITETLLAQKHAEIERIVGEPLWPSYSYVRRHGRGAVLAPHTDRDASEIAVTIAIGGDREWPIWFRTGAGDVSVGLAPGDAVVYEGRQLAHWRAPYDGDTQIQCMLFYVKQHGPNAHARFDGRPGVGYPWIPPKSPLARRAIGKLRRMAGRLAGRH